MNRGFLLSVAGLQLSGSATGGGAALLLQNVWSDHTLIFTGEGGGFVEIQRNVTQLQQLFGNFTRQVSCETIARCAQ